MKKILLLSMLITTSAFANTHNSSNYSYDISAKITDGKTHFFAETKSPVSNPSFTHWEKDGNHLKLILSKKVGNKILASYTVGYQTVENNDSCLGNIKQKGCYTAYAGVENNTVLLTPGVINHIPLITLKNGVKRELDISLIEPSKFKASNDAIKPFEKPPESAESFIINKQIPTIQPKKDITIPKYNIELSLDGKSVGGNNNFILSGDLGEQLAYGSSETKEYVAQMLKNTIKDSNTGIVGAIIMKENDDKKSKKNLTVLIGLDSSIINAKDYPGYGDPNIDGVRITVKTDVNSHNGEWVPFTVSGHNDIKGKIRVSETSDLK